jgi:hypothetical protein
LNNTSLVKNKIKKVDRLESNEKLHGELQPIYEALSKYVIKYLSQDAQLPIIIDLCYLKDDKDIQMMSAEVANKGRTIPLYRELFKQGELGDRALTFIENLSNCLPSNRKIMVIMDAGFGESWFKNIEAQGWYWLVRVRQGKCIKVSEETGWESIKDFIPKVGEKSKSYNKAYLMKEHNRPCRIITTYKSPSRVRKKPARAPSHDKAGSDSYRRSAKEPWILATNLPLEYNTTQIITYYSKRMQIEESFRDIKSHQLGLSARYVRTRCIHRWSVKMLLAAIVQIMFWIIGVIGHSQGFQRVFQANTVRDRKVFSYFYLGQLIVQYDKLNEIIIDYDSLPALIEQELMREW